MLKKIEHTEMRKGHSDWFQRSFHIPIDKSQDPKHRQFGVLLTLNDDQVNPQTGFDTHHHQDTEMICYIISGEMIHGDSMGNLTTLQRGQFHYLCAGTGILHCKHNLNSQPLRYLQIAIAPDANSLIPEYKKELPEWDKRKNKWYTIVSGEDGEAEIKINQDVNICVIELDAGQETRFPVHKDRQAYLIQLEGSAQIQNHALQAKDALVSIEEDILIEAIETSHLIIIEMKKSES